MRCGEHCEQTTRPHFLQWCLRNRNVNCLLHTGQWVTWASGCHGGRSRSLSRLDAESVWARGEYDGGGGSGRSRDCADVDTGDESSTMGWTLEPACELLRIRRDDGRRVGGSAVVRRLLRSELLPEDGESVRAGGGGREGRASKADEVDASEPAVMVLGAVDV